MGFNFILRSSTLFAYGLVNISTPKAVNLTLAEPFTAAMLGVVVFDENLTGVSIIGVLLLFWGLIINSYPEKEKCKRENKNIVILEP
ncbi:EamA family transporter [Maledivibacter halophilus]|uniref:EamA family transporter n=1 Tax=Maledivibacter halophilus TaxID=36842 RepID=UPI001FCAF043|nr:EamA family transporter [Maledivibacter halophilus]